MARRVPLLIAALFILPVAGRAADPGEGGCGSGEQSRICVGRIQVPASKLPLFQTASTQAVDALASPGFRADLAQFIAGLSPSDAHSAAWTNRDADALVAGLLRGVNGVPIKTYGGFWAYIIAKGPARNVAKEGKSGGPIRLNLHALGSSAEIANSIAHEAAHRTPLLLGHPSYDSDVDVGYCEPPYVIGQLVQKQIQGAAWKPGDTDCDRLPNGQNS
jgi:hypothetical protein